jgi:hypothetical protein
MAAVFGAMDRGDGQIQPPSFDENPSHWTVFIGFVVLIVLLFMFSVFG